MITKRELAELFTILGLISKNNKLRLKFSRANNAREPPLCSKKAKKAIENIINISAEKSFLRLAASFSLNVS